jgi:tetratricopeptide (TPR) repeat protein
MGGEFLGQALENFNKVIEIDHTYAPSYNGRGLVWDRLYKYSEALADFSNSI